jgi:hypothetical protein
LVYNRYAQIYEVLGLTCICEMPSERAHLACVRCQIMALVPIVRAGPVELDTGRQL